MRARHRCRSENVREVRAHAGSTSWPCRPSTQRSKRSASTFSGRGGAAKRGSLMATIASQHVERSPAQSRGRDGGPRFDPDRSRDDGDGLPRFSCRTTSTRSSTRRSMPRSFRCYEQGEPLDKITLDEELKTRGVLEKVGGMSYLSSLMNTVPTAASVEYYAKIVREKSTLRGLIHAGTSVTQIGFEAEVGRRRRRRPQRADRLRGRTAASDAASSTRSRTCSRKPSNRSTGSTTAAATAPASRRASATSTSSRPGFSPATSSSSPPVRRWARPPRTHAGRLRREGRAASRSRSSRWK